MLPLSRLPQFGQSKENRGLKETEAELRPIVGQRRIILICGSRKAALRAHIKMYFE